MKARNLRPAIELIKSFEGCVLQPYLDSANIPTIGIGTTRYPDGRRVSMSDPHITLEQAEEYLRHHMLGDCRSIEKFCDKYKLDLNDNQFSALVCFSYNLGIAPVVTPGRSLCDAILSGNKSKVPPAMMLYSKANVGGVMTQLRGLVRRRKAEGNLYVA